MLVSGQGVVLNSLRYGETSVITKILTKDHGVVPFMIQGVYRKKARISYSQLQPFSLLEMVYYYKENRQMQKVKEVKVQPALNNLQTNVAKTAVALFAVEVLNNVISDNEPDEFLYPWLEGFVLDLDHAAKVDPFISHIFLIQLASQLGFAPSAEGIGQYFNMEEGRFSETAGARRQYMDQEESTLLKGLLAGDVANHTRQELRKSLLDQLIIYFEKHVTGFKPLKSLKVLHDVFA